MDLIRKAYTRTKERVCKDYNELMKTDNGESYFDLIVRRELEIVNTKLIIKYNRTIIAATTDDPKNAPLLVKLTHIDQNSIQKDDPVQVAQNVMDTGHLAVKKYRICRKKLAKAGIFLPTDYKTNLFKLKANKFFKKKKLLMGRATQSTPVKKLSLF